MIEVPQTAFFSRISRQQKNTRTKRRMTQKRERRKIPSSHRRCTDFSKSKDQEEDNSVFSSQQRKREQRSWKYISGMNIYECHGITREVTKRVALRPLRQDKKSELRNVFPWKTFAQRVWGCERTRDFYGSRYFSAASLFMNRNRDCQEKGRVWSAKERCQGEVTHDMQEQPFHLFFY